MSDIQGIPSSDGLQMLLDNRNKGGIWQAVESGFHMLGNLVIAFFFWPLLLGLPFPKITTWEIIIIEAIWLCVVGMFIRHRRRR